MRLKNIRVWCVIVLAAVVATTAAIADEPRHIGPHGTDPQPAASGDHGVSGGADSSAVVIWCTIQGFGSAWCSEVPDSIAIPPTRIPLARGKASVAIPQTTRTFKYGFVKGVESNWYPGIQRGGDIVPHGARDPGSDFLAVRGTDGNFRPATKEEVAAYQRDDLR